MAESSRFFDSTTSDVREYSAADFAGYFHAVISDGIIPYSSDLAVTTSSGLNIKVKAGRAWVQGYFYELDEDTTLTLEKDTVSRTDLIVLRLDTSNDVRAVNLKVLKGTTAPTRSDAIYDLVIAKVYVPASATSISASNITDTRSDLELCGKAKAVGVDAAVTGYDHKVEITTSQTWTVPTGVTEIAVRLFGGGGGGYSSGGGGGGGHMAYKVFTVTPGTSYTITIGSGGAASGDGGSTIFGSLLTARGGDGGGSNTGGSGGTGGGCKQNGYGGNASYGGGGGGYKNWASFESTIQSGFAGVYGGTGGGDSESTTATSGFESNGGTNTNKTSSSNGSSANVYPNATGGGGGYKADGGDGYYYYTTSSTPSFGGGGGGGWEGGKGGSTSTSIGAGGGGYGTTKLSATGTYGGTGYGAGGGGDGSAGAPGICIIYY